MSSPHTIQFFAGGPDFPLRLLDEWEKGDLVFFCGAGVSMNEGLPSFRDLVEKVRDSLNHTFTQEESDAFGKEKYDIALELLELKFGSEVLRKAVMAKLEMPRGKSKTHQAILDLAKTPDDKYRVVTTNFDHGFKKHGGKHVPFNSAPLIPIPKKEKWKSLVYLHGIIDKEHDEHGSDLILTSSDFGRAYLTERWASRFITELFRRFSVLFLGYSIEDPILRYLMDAIAAERRIEEGSIKEAYILDCPEDGENFESKKQFWETRGITPLLYDAYDKHRALHNSLHNWSRKFKDRISGKISFVINFSESPGDLVIDGSSPEVQQLLWVLKDSGGIPAKIFSEIAPTPSIDWLPLFDKNGLLGESDQKETDSSKNKNPTNCWAGGLSQADARVSLPESSKHLMKWFCKHLDSHEENQDSFFGKTYKNKALDFVLRHGGLLHLDLAYEILTYLKEHSLKEPYSKVWFLMAQHSIDTSSRGRAYDYLNDEVYKIFSSKKIDILQLKLFISDHYRPYYVFKSPSAFGVTGSQQMKMSSLIEVNVEIEKYHSFNYLEIFLENKNNKNAFIEFVPVLFNLLEEVWLKYSAAEKISKEFDGSHITHPSIEPHSQNSDSENWCRLVDLLYRGMVLLSKKNGAMVNTYIERCKNLEYPLFRRMALAFQAINIKNPECQATAIHDLLSSEELLWWSGYGAEKYHVIRELVKVKKHSKLFSVILKGPSRKFYAEGLSREDFSHEKEGRIFTMIEKIIEYKGSLNQRLKNKHKALKKKHPSWKIDTGKKSEMAHWYSGVSRVEDRPISQIPWDEMSREEIQSKLTEVDGFFDEVSRGWYDYVQKSPSGRTNCLGHLEYLHEISEENSSVWQKIIFSLRESLKSPSEINSYWNKILKIKPEILNEFLHRVSSKLKEDSKELSQVTFLKLYDHLLGISIKSESGVLTGDVYLKAINHPLGQLAQALLEKSWPKDPQKGKGLPKKFVSRMKKVISLNGENALMGKVVLASRASTIHWLDPAFVEKNLSPLFSWEEPCSLHVWDAFLNLRRVDSEFFSSIKSYFLEAFEHLADFQENASENLIRVLAILALEKKNVLDEKEIKGTVHGLGTKHLEVVASFLYETMARSENTSVTWDQEIKPFIEKYWPKEKKKQSPMINEKMSQILLSLGKNAPENYSFLKQFIGKGHFRDLGYFCHCQIKSEHIKNPAYSKIVVRLFKDTLPSSKPDRMKIFPLSKLRKLLDHIIESHDSIKKTSGYKEINTTLLKWGV